MSLDILVDNIMHRLNTVDVIVYLIRRSVGYCEMYSDKAIKVLENYPRSIVGIYRRGVNRAHIFEDISYCLANVNERAGIYKKRGA